MKYSTRKKEILETKLSQLSKESFLHLPTPLQISKRKKLFIKREDLSGLSLGGNKSRRYEYFFNEIRSKGFTSVLHCVSLYSNDAAQISAAAKIMGMNVHLIFRYDDSSHTDNLSNFTLSNLAGSNLYVVPNYYVNEYYSNLANNLGENVYCIRTGLNAYSVELHSILGCISYVDCFIELLNQVGDVEISQIILESGGSSQAGLILASKFLECDVEIVANNPSHFNAPEREKFVKDLISESAKFLDLDIPEVSQVHQEQNIGKGYGKLDLDSFRKITLQAVNEGIFLDPIYTSKSFELFDEDSNSFKIYIHTGGLSNIFTFSSNINQSSNVIKVKLPLAVRLKKFFKNFLHYTK